MKVIPEARRVHLTWYLDVSHIYNTSMVTLTSTQTTRYHKFKQSCLLWLCVNIDIIHLPMV